VQPEYDYEKMITSYYRNEI